jgi:uncharacterized membrane protein (DUF106 family)
METLNHILNFTFDGLLGLFSGLNPSFGLLAVSVITGVLMLLVFRHTSDQKGIKRAKNLVKAHFLAIRLYKDDISQMLSTMKNIIVSNLFYMSKSLKPMMFMLVPVALVLIQLDSRYEHRPFKIGEPTIVSVRLTPDKTPSTLSALSEVTLHAPEGIKIETPPLRIPEKLEVAWRIRMEKEGIYDLIIQSGGQKFSKRLNVSSELTALALNKERTSFTAALFNPAEISLPSDSPFESIAITYPKRTLNMFGVSFHWLAGFFVLSLIAGFALKGVFKVEI